MLKLFAIFWFGIITFIGASSFAQSYPLLGGRDEAGHELSFESRFKKISAVLEDLGFIDYPRLISQTLKNNSEISDVSAAALKKNQFMLASIPAANRLASYLYACLMTESGIPKLNLVEKMITQQLLPFPLISLEDLGEGTYQQLAHLPIDVALAKKRELAKVRAQQRFLTEKTNLLKAFLLVSPRNKREEVETRLWLEDQINTAISDSYKYFTRQQNRFLGRALVLAFVYYLRETGQEAIEKVLKTNLRAKNLFLENYISPNYISDSGIREHDRLQLESGNLAFEYYHGQESFFTSLVINPSSAQDYKISQKYQLQGDIFNIFGMLDGGPFYSVLDKLELKRPLSEKEKAIYEKFWDPKLAKGFSHSGIVEVKTEPRFNLSAVWIYDSYPERDKVGPIRVMSISGFAYGERMLKLGFVKYSPTLLLRAFKKQIAQRGYRPFVWEGFDSYMGRTSDGELIPSYDKDIKYSWPSRIGKEEIEMWMQTRDSEASDWYHRELIPAVMKRIRSYVAGPDAALFASGFSNGKNLLYCSQMILMAFLQGGNFDLQSEPDQVWQIIKLFSDDVKRALQLSLGQRIVSPNGLIWQHSILSRFVEYPLSRSNYEKQLSSSKPSVAEIYTEFLTPEARTFELIDYSPIPLDKDEVIFDVET